MERAEGPLARPELPLLLRQYRIRIDRRTIEINLEIQVIALALLKHVGRRSADGVSRLDALTLLHIDRSERLVRLCVTIWRVDDDFIAIQGLIGYRLYGS